MPVARVFKVEQLDLLGDLPRRQPRPPLVHQLGEDAVRSALLHLAQPPKLRQLVVRHPHVGLLARAPNKVRVSRLNRKKRRPRESLPYLVSLYIRFCKRLQLRRGNGGQEAAWEKTQTSLPTSTGVGLLTARESEAGSSLVPTQ